MSHIYRKTGELEKIVSIPIFKEDDYYSIARRFLEALGDKNLVDGYFLLSHNGLHEKSVIEGH